MAGGLARGFGIVHRRQEHERDRCVVLEAARQVEAGHAGHADVQQCEGDVGFALGHALQCFGGGFGRHRIVTGMVQYGFQVIEQEGIVVDQQDQPAGR